MPLSKEYREWLEDELHDEHPRRYDGSLGYTDPEHKKMKAVCRGENVEIFQDESPEDRILWRFTHILLILESNGADLC